MLTVMRKSKGHPIEGHEITEGSRYIYIYIYSSTPSSTLALNQDGWSGSRPGHITPREWHAPIVLKAGWATGSVWTGAENLVCTGIRFAVRPARSGSLYRLLTIKCAVNKVTSRVKGLIKLNNMSMYIVTYWLLTVNKTRPLQGFSLCKEMGVNQLIY